MALGSTQSLTEILKSGNLNLLEPSGPVQACNGIALPLLHFTFRSFNNMKLKVPKIVFKIPVLT